MKRVMNLWVPHKAKNFFTERLLASLEELCSMEFVFKFKL